MKITGMKHLAVVAALMTWAALIGTFSTPVFAQSTTGSVYGTVTDTTGGLIPNASVTAKNVQNGFTATVKSSAGGAYLFPNLEPGNYTVSAAATGFKEVTETGIVLSANQNVHVLFNMPVGNTGETVTVTAASTLVDTRESTLATTIDQQRLQEMPVPTRDPYSLISLSPGVQGLSNGSSTGSGFMGDNVGTTFSTNGMRIYENSYFLDGADFLNYFKPGGNIPPDTDALQEIRVITSNADAEFGTMPGAVVNMISRGGTNHYHGLLFEYIRNTIFNARTEFQAPPGHLRQNVFGGNIGGPALHDKLFGFFSYQGVRIATNTTLSPGAAIVPTAAERTGDFSGDSVIPTCGATTYPCVGQPGNPGTTPGVIPAAYLDPVVQKMLKFIPVGTTPATKSIGGQTPLQVANSPVTDNQYLGRVDYQLSRKQRLSFIYVHNYGQNPSPTSGGQTVLGYAGDLLADAETNYIGTHTWTISANMLNTFRGYYTASHYASGDLFPNTNLPSQLGITAPCGGDPCTQPNVRMAGFIASFGNSGSAPTTIAGVNVGFGDTFIWIRGAHSLKLGGTGMRSRFDYNTIGQREGIYTVGKGFTNNNLADFLLGKSTTFNQSNGSVGTESFHRIEPSVFVQDDWKVSRRVTLDLGLRWETFPPVHGLNNMGSFAPNIQSSVLPTAPIGVLFNGDANVPDGVLRVSYAKFAPRVGFAYDVFGDGKTSLRGGFGIFYSQVAETWFYQLSSPVFNESIALTNTTNFTNPYSGSTTLPVSPFPYTPNLTNPVFGAGLVFTGMPYGNKSIPYALEYNLTVEHQFSSNWAASISYVGNGTRRFYAVVDENAPVYSPSCTSATCSTTASLLARRPYKPTGTSYVFNAVTELIPEASGSFDSLQASLTKRLSHGFSINANYVWEKAMSVAADPTNNALTAISSSNNYNLNSDRGQASTMVPQSFKVSYLWVSPEIHRWGVFGKEVLSGWSFNGITTLRTGSPLNVVSGSDTNFDGTATTDRPNQVADWHLAAHRSRADRLAQYFNTAAFVAVPAGTATGQGTTQFDTIIGPGSENTDLAAYKSFRVYKENKVLFRAEAYNLFNNVNLGNPGVSFSSPASFGKITSAASGRIMQFAVRYSF